MDSNHSAASMSLIRVLVIPLVLILSSCAVSNPVSTAPSQFGAIESSLPIETESEFLDKIAGKQLKLLNDSVQASLVFNRDGTASGSLVTNNGEELDMELDWVWENAAYCVSAHVPACRQAP